MFLKHFFLFITGILFLFSIELFSQNKVNDTIKDYEGIDNFIDSQKDTSAFVWKPCISPFVELFGKGFLSLNVDFRRKETYAISIGAALIEEGVSPNVMGYYFAGKRHRIETGGGISGNIMDGTIINMMVHGVIGYRYQKKKGLLFRAGFTPMFVIPFTDESKYAIIPWAGLSLGYSF
jgi:hypothetical protein